MSVCCNCVKTTADSNENNDKTMFLNISESYIEYNIFDTEQSSVESNSYIIKRNYDFDITSKIKLIKI